MNFVTKRINPLYKIQSPFPIDQTKAVDKKRRSTSRNPLSLASHQHRASEQSDTMLQLVSSSCRLLERDSIPWKKTPSAKRQFRLQSAIIRSKRLGINSKDTRADSEIDGYTLTKVSRPNLETN